ncbi:hypothetical protein DVH05_025739 [Phytophthora capsici]|nr:hypothetical protein DVH05_025739 [Phytophthora capsici]
MSSPPAGARHRRPPDPGGRSATGVDTPARGGTEDEATSRPSTQDNPCSTQPNPGLVTRPSSHITRSYAAAVRTVAGVTPSKGMPPRQTNFSWPPATQAKLDRTLARDWSTPLVDVASEEVLHLRSVALAEAHVHADATLRTQTDIETEAFMAYLRGELEIPHPPNFLKSTMPVVQRSMVEEFHEVHLDGILTADIPPQVQLRRNMTGPMLLRELALAQQGVLNGQELVTALERDLKALYFDGNRTLHFVFPSRRVAVHYQGITLRLQRVAIDLELVEELGDRVYSRPHLRRRYSLRLLGADGLGISTVIGALANIAGIPVLDAERPRDSAISTGARHFTVWFEQNDCPGPLRGVTKIFIGSTEVTLHHHLLHYRLPCHRCYSPRHTTGFCKTKPGLLTDYRNRCTRKLSGSHGRFTVGPMDRYRHSDKDSLATFWRSLVAGFSLAEADMTKLQLERVGGVPEEEQSNRSPAQGTGTVVRSTTDGDFTIVRRKARSSKKKGEAHRTGPTLAVEGTFSDADGAANMSQALSPLEQDNPALETTTTGDVAGESRDSEGANTELLPSRNRSTGYGRYQALMEEGSQSGDDSGSDMDISVDGCSGAEEAGYAFPEEDRSLSEAEDVAGGESLRPPHSTGRAHKSPTGADTSDAVGYSVVKADLPRHADTDRPTDMDVDESPEMLDGSSDINATPVASDATAYVGSSAPTHSVSPATTPGSEIPFSLASTGSDLHSDELAQATDDLAISNSQASDQVTYQGIQHPTADPIPTRNWLSLFNGEEVSVPGNGQCALLALFSSVTNHRAGSLALTPEVKRDAAVFKRAVYALLISNLRADCALGVIDPAEEIARLYPEVDLPTSAAVSMALLCNHMSLERMRPVDVQIPKGFWANLHVLRTYAQYLRLPLVVLDVNEAGNAHVQLYTYGDREVMMEGCATPLTHETGQCTVLADAEATAYLNMCGRLHVLPIFLLLKHHESHFYGVQHGETFFQWQAEGDPAYAGEISHPYEWIHDCLDGQPGLTVTDVQPANRFELGFAVKLRGMPIDLREDADTVNALLHKGLTMRQRLDVAHFRLGWPVLDAAPLDRSLLVETMLEEEDHILQATHPCSDGGLAPGERPQGLADLPKRFKPRQLCRVTGRAYRELLHVENLEAVPLDMETTLRKTMTANDEAFSKWYNLRRHTLAAIEELTGELGISSLVTARAVNTDLIRSLFGALPYPELAAKQVPLEALLSWGRREVYRDRLGFLMGLAEDESQSGELREYCADWVEGLTLTPDDTQLGLLDDGEQWGPLHDWRPRLVETVGKPPGCPTAEWELLHILPFTVRQWRATAMGRSDARSRAVWYLNYPPVRRLCQGARSGNWEIAPQLPTGLTWDEQADSQWYPAGVTTPRK